MTMRSVAKIYGSASRVNEVGLADLNMCNTSPVIVVVVARSSEQEGRRNPAVTDEKDRT